MRWQYFQMKVQIGMIAFRQISVISIGVKNACVITIIDMDYMGNNFLDVHMKIIITVTIVGNLWG